MTLDRWARLGLMPDKTVRGHAGGSWTRSTGSRHCPDCLGEREGAFRLAWFLHWSHSCVQHRCLMVPTTSQTHLVDPCYGLSAALPVPLRADHPVLETQGFLNRLLDTPRAEVVSITGERPAREVFEDAIRPDCHKNGTTYPATYGRMYADKPAPTLTGGFLTPGRGRFIHPTRPRVLTPREAARVQGFPDWYRFDTDPAEAPSRAQLATWIGNAVPTILGYVATLAAIGGEKKAAQSM